MDENKLQQIKELLHGVNSHAAVLSAYMNMGRFPKKEIQERIKYICQFLQEINFIFTYLDKGDYDRTLPPDQTPA